MTRAAFGLGRERTTTCRHVSVPDPTTSTSERRGAFDAACAEIEPSPNEPTANEPSATETMNSAATVRADAIQLFLSSCLVIAIRVSTPPANAQSTEGRTAVAPRYSFVAPPSPLSP